MANALKVSVKAVANSVRLMAGAVGDAILVGARRRSAGHGGGHLEVFLTHIHDIRVNR